MLIRLAKHSDTDQIFELFRDSSVSKAQLAGGVPKRGFFEYHLDYPDISARVDAPFSIVHEDSKGRILGYVLAYPLSNLPKPTGAHQDPVHNRLSGFDKSVVYIDQLCIHPDYPITLASRLGDTFEHVLRMERVPGVITAIPEAPWQNVSSTRLVLARGFSRQGIVLADEFNLRLYAKPYLDLDIPFEHLGDDVLFSH